VREGTRHEVIWLCIPWLVGVTNVVQVRLFQFVQFDYPSLIMGDLASGKAKGSSKSWVTNNLWFYVTHFEA